MSIKSTCVNLIARISEAVQLKRVTTHDPHSSSAYIHTLLQVDGSKFISFF